MRLLFYHSGPGLNSHPEKNLLTEDFATAKIDFRCWNEPSTLRPEGVPFNAEHAFQNYLDSAETFLLENYEGQPLYAIGHSFGAHAVNYLAHLHPDKLQHLFFVCPNFSVASTDMNTFRFIIKDYQKQQDDRSVQLAVILENYTGKFDENTMNGFALVAQNPRYFSYCWHNKSRFDQSISYYTAPKYILDVDAYFAVRKSWRNIALKNCNIPVTVIVGAKDLVITNAKELDEIKKRFIQVDYHEFENSAHNPHLEETECFIDLCKMILRSDNI